MDNSIAEGKLHFSGWPVKRGMGAYDVAIKKITELCRQNKHVLSAYTFGEITCPGISDIDLIFVLKDGAKGSGFIRHMPHKKELDYVVCHPFFIINEHIMENMNCIYPSSNFRKIFGKKISIKKLGAEKHKKALSFLTADVVLRHLPGDFINPLMSGKINVRTALLRLNSLRHSIEAFRKINGQIGRQWQDYSDDVTTLRQDWFSLGRTEQERRLASLMERSVNLSYEFITQFGKNFPCNEKQAGIIFKGTKERISFDDELSAGDAVSAIQAHYKKHGNFYSILPSMYANQLFAYASSDGPLSGYIRANLSKNPGNTCPDEVLMSRVGLLNEQVSIAQKLKHSHYPCFFPLGYKNTSGIVNKIRYFAIIASNNSFVRRLPFH